MKDNKTLYLCDGCACDEMCATKKTIEEWDAYECHHTSDEDHARNKCRRDRKFDNVNLPDGTVRRVEKP